MKLQMRLFSAGLQAAFPDVALITEEQAESHALKGTEFLIVDPLDGTKEFVHRRGDFTVNIAYVVNGVPVRGIVYAPAKQRLFYTDAQGQSWRKPVHLRWRKLEYAKISRSPFQILMVYALSPQNHIGTKQQMPISQNIKYRI